MSRVRIRSSIKCSGRTELRLELVSISDVRVSVRLRLRVLVMHG